VVAKRNTERHGVADQIEFVQEDMTETLQNHPAPPKIDLIVSNPPYVPTADLKAGHSRDTVGLTFEPEIALDGGPDGQKFINQIKNAGVPALVESTHGEIISFFMS
jgi:release factor glutamine methyltransferase